MQKGHRLIQLPLEVDIEDFEEYETSHDVRVSLVYCIDLSSTMRYSSMFGDLSRIEDEQRRRFGGSSFLTRNSSHPIQYLS